MVFGIRGKLKYMITLIGCMRLRWSRGILSTTSRLSVYTDVLSRSKEGTMSTYSHITGLHRKWLCINVLCITIYNNYKNTDLWAMRTGICALTRLARQPHCWMNLAHARRRPMRTELWAFRSALEICRPRCRLHCIQLVAATTCSTDGWRQQSIMRRAKDRRVS